jgi:hypothetical protein
MGLLDQNFFSSVVAYEATIITLVVVLIGALAVTQQKWADMQFRRVEYEGQRIKALLKTIASIDLDANQELRQELIAKQRAFKILV